MFITRYVCSLSPLLFENKNVFAFGISDINFPFCLLRLTNVSVLVCVLGLAATVGAPFSSPLPKLTSIVSRWQSGSDRYSGPYSCPNCSRVYQHRPSLSQHLKHECGKEPQFQCPFCPQRTTQKGSLRKHMRRRHNFESCSQYL